MTACGYEVAGLWLWRRRLDCTCQADLSAIDDVYGSHAVGLRTNRAHKNELHEST